MKKLISLSLAAIAVVSLSGCAPDGMMKQHSMQGGTAMHGGMDMKLIDTNGDGMISREEFAKHHDSMYDKMKKDSNGMVSIKDMQMMHDGMMKK